MREGIHPNYHQATVTCNCGNTFTTGSTKEDIHVEICSKCHPFYTGQQKAAQARGRIDKFNKKYNMVKIVGDGGISHRPQFFSLSERIGNILLAFDLGVRI